MISLLASAENPALPNNTGYVAAAYLVFLALVVVYVAIMAYRLSRIETEVLEIHELLSEKRREGERR